MELRELRKSKNLSQQDIAKELEISKSTVSEWERGNAIPRSEKMKELANYFGEPIEKILKCFYS